MRVVVVGIALAGLGCLCTSAQAEALCASAVRSGQDVEEVRSLERRGARSNVEGWSIDEAKAFFAPTWVSVGPDGSVSGVEPVFEGFVDGRSKPWASRFDLVEVDIRVYCDAAVVIGLAEAEGIGAKPGARVVRFRFLNVWRKVDGRWLYSEQQFTRF